MKDNSKHIFDVTYKVILIGDKVGKSSIVQRYISDTFSDTPANSIGIEVHSKELSIDDKLIKLQIVDTSSDIQFKGIAKNYLKSVQGVILVFDLTNQESFDSLSAWLKIVKDSIEELSCMILVGNKFDLISEIKVSSDLAKKRSRSLGIEYVECSAKTNSNISTIFETLTITMYQVYGTDNLGDLRKRPSAKDVNESGSGCNLI